MVDRRSFTSTIRNFCHNQGPCISVVAVHDVARSVDFELDHVLHRYRYRLNFVGSVAGPLSVSSVVAIVNFMASATSSAAHQQCLQSLRDSWHHADNLYSQGVMELETNSIPGAREKLLERHLVDALAKSGSDFRMTVLMDLVL